MSALVAACLARVPALRMLERGWLSANNFVFLDGNGLDGDAPWAPARPAGGAVVVDTGYASHAAQTLALVDTVLGGRRLGAVINTHLHSDHCGGNAALRAAHDCAVLIPPGDADVVAAWDEAAMSYAATCQDCPRFTFDGVLRPGQALRLGGAHWVVHAAPGHDPHAVMLFAPEPGLLISGDALWENGLGIIFPALRGEPGFDEAIAALELIERLAPQCVLPGHGPAFADVPAAIARARARLARWQADPERHASYALKALIQFLLLDRRELDLGEIAALLARGEYFRLLNAQWFQLDDEALARHVAGALHDSGAAVFDGARLRLA